MSSPEQFNYVSRDRWGKHQWVLLRELLEARGVVEYHAFRPSGEGFRLPSGLEGMSWAVLTKDGRVATCFLEWDGDKIAPDGSRGYYALEQLEAEAYSPERAMEKFGALPEFLHGRRVLALPLTPAQEHILRAWEERQKGN